eukprot:4007481-Amphidinium_carterae.1
MNRSGNKRSFDGIQSQHKIPNEHALCHSTRNTAGVWALVLRLLCWYYAFVLFWPYWLKSPVR